MAAIDPLMTPGGIPANITNSTPNTPVDAFGNPVAGSGLGYGGNGNPDSPAGMRPIGSGLGYNGDDPVAAESTYPVDVVDMLNDLLENAHDGEYGFTACAEEVDDASQLKSVFSERATQCRAAGTELAALISQYGGKPADGGTTSGALHRAWVHTKAAVGANGAVSLLEECERGEDAALARYRKALKADLPADVRSLVERQAQGAQRNHDQIKSLRDQARAAD
jgi:uncharacterized protein (TIGR02284 family)